MARIRVLPDSLIDRIAAGEVVERPASVVKELIENALDAGARSVAVMLAGGGKQKIRVEDDGSGMDRDDALLALERHATSKIRDASDLEAIATLGFRGEALSSIAAVSRMVLRTSPENGAGTEVDVRGGRIVSVREAGLPRGTSIDVDRLFFNVPARRKFLRADSTELSHVTRLVTQCALAHPEVRFSLEHGDRSVLRVDPASDLAERVSQIHGRSFGERMLAFDAGGDGLRVHGLAGRPADALPRRAGQYLFVNGRPVQDRVLAHAVGEAYGNTMPHGRHPMIFLFLEIDAALVDVNVHPRKNEVRFRQSGAVHDRVRAAVSTSLSRGAVVPTLGDLRGGARPGVPRSGTRSGPGFLDLPAGHAYPAASDRPPAPQAPLREPVRAAEAGPIADGPTVDGGAGARRLVPLAQYRDSYIVAQDDEGLVLVDQHAAHERVLFERYLAEADENRVEVQRLLFPVTVELAPHESILLEREQDELLRLGFVVEPFGGTTFRIDGVPAVAAELDPERLLRELLGEAERSRSAASDVAALRRKLVTTAACRAAVKVNDPLTRESMQRLLDDLLATVSPSTCPHGRPLLFRLPLAEIERAFGRR